MDNGDVQMSGPIADAFDMLAQRVNFTYTLHRAVGDTWGIKGPEGWTGLLGMLSRDEVDLALGPFTLTYGRWSAFPMSVPMYVDTVEILVPTLEWRMSLFNKLSVFTYGVWILLFSSVFSLCFVLSLIDKYEYPHSRFLKSFLKYFWDIMRTLLQKGRIRRPIGISRVMLNVLWMLTAMVISQLFGGVVLTTHLLRRVRKIDSLDDIIAAHDMQPILEFQSSIFAAFRDGEPEVYRSIFKKVLKNPDQCILSFKNMSTIGMDFVFSGSFSLITDGMGLRSFLEKRNDEGLPCNFRLAKEQLWPMWKVIAFKETFPEMWIRKINQILRYSFESGWLHQRMIYEFSGYTQCLSEGNSEVEGLHLQHIIGTFIIWAIGCSVSVVVFVAEFYSHRKKAGPKSVNYAGYSNNVNYSRSEFQFRDTLQRVLPICSKRN